MVRKFVMNIKNKHLNALRHSRRKRVLGLISSLLLLAYLLSLGAPVVKATDDEVTDLDDDEISAEVGELITGEGYELVAEEGGKKLFVNLTTSEIAVEDQQSGERWYSNPQDRESDSIANGANKSRLGSQLLVQYYTPNAQQVMKDNYLDSIAHEQFEVELLEDGVKISYIIGEKPAEYIHPVAITEERFLEIFEMSDKSAQRILNRRYTKYDIDEMKEADANAMLENYPGLADQPLYLLRDGISGFILEEISAAFEAAGYTEEEKIADEALAGMDSVASEDVYIGMSIYYSLDDGDLIVRMPIDEITFPENYPLTRVRLLEYFGAGGLEDEGYLFVPDGSGALIQFNNGKLSATQYLSSVYGNDVAVRQGIQVGMTEQIALPVFGVKKNNQAFLAIIEEGSALAQIRADISGRINAYNTVSPVFQILQEDQVDLKELAGNNVIMAYQQAPYEGDIRLRYRFLVEDEADYSGMANSYREYLYENDILSPLTENKMPVQLEILSAVDLIKPIAGIPINTVQELTSYKESQNIIQDLHDAGITDLDLRLSGWFNGGLRQSAADKIKLQRQLGSKADFNALSDLAKDLDYGFYPDVSFSFNYRNTLFDSFIQTRDASRFLDREVVELGEYRPSTMKVPPTANPFWYISPETAAGYADSFLDSFSSYETSGLSIRDAGQYLGADYNRKSEVDRESALNIWTDILAEASASEQKVMLEYGNAYSLAAADVLIDLPAQSSLYQIADQSVPFLQMVLHGSVDYSLEAYNLASNSQDAFLSMIETAANPRFVVMDEANSILKDSSYTQYFSVEYEMWREPILEIASELESIIAPLRTETIVRHEYLADLVSKVTYSNGTEIYVNRTALDYESEDVSIPAMDYLVKEGA